MKQTLKQELLELEKQVQQSKDFKDSPDGSSNLPSATDTKTQGHLKLRAQTQLSISEVEDMKTKILTVELT